MSPSAITGGRKDFTEIASFSRTPQSPILRQLPAPDEFAAKWNMRPSDEWPQRLGGGPNAGHNGRLILSKISKSLEGI
jgi:hypothetical protein